ncbi:class III lanthionine synthetase LanKC [Streptomyces sp. NPDC002285]
MSESRKSVFESFVYACSDPEFYAPLVNSPSSESSYKPSVIPTDWANESNGVWSMLKKQDTVIADQGWKIHVSSRIGRVQFVLDTVAGACFRRNVPFKHLRSEWFFLLMHHKHGFRTQSGKFCVLYPQDEDTARILMEELSSSLSLEEGPYILTDRRFRDSKNVHYRYGAFIPGSNIRSDGTIESTIRDGHGNIALDKRIPSFTLPDGVIDPFTREVPHTAPGEIVINGYQVMRALQISNAGGTYEGKHLDSGRRVFIKEARAHNGLHWDGSTAQQRLKREYETLLQIQEVHPGLCPQPLAYFREWEHEFLVTEFIAGEALWNWVARNNPAVQANRTAARYEIYYDACWRIYKELESDLARLHKADYRFGDVSPKNILVDEDLSVRLVDFETCTRIDEPPVTFGTDGFMPQDPGSLDNEFAVDNYGLSAVALTLIGSFHSHLKNHPSGLRWLRRDLEETSKIPERLWRKISRNYPSISMKEEPCPIPSPEDLENSPRESLIRFLEQVRDGVLSTASLDHPERVFPTVPQGFRTNTLCFNYGTAGVLHALQIAGAKIPEPVVDRFCKEATERAHELPPGLYVGTAGVACVLAKLGRVDEAMDMLALTARHSVLAKSSDLSEGLAGVGLAYIQMHRMTGAFEALEQALKISDELCDRIDKDQYISEKDPTGLLNGRSGIALFLHAIAERCGSAAAAAVGHRLMREEIQRAIALPDGSISFPEGRKSRRMMPYLSSGSAGVALALTRYAARTSDEELLTALPRALDDTRKMFAVMPGLYGGLAGLAFTLADYAYISGSSDAQRQALQIGTGLVKYANPGPAGVRFIGDGGMRFSAELWSGGAGVLLALHSVLYGSADHLLLI